MKLSKSVQVGEVERQKEKEKGCSYVLSYEAPPKKRPFILWLTFGSHRICKIKSIFVKWKCYMFFKIKLGLNEKMKSRTIKSIPVHRTGLPTQKPWTRQGQHQSELHHLDKKEPWSSCRVPQQRLGHLSMPPHIKCTELNFKEEWPEQRLWQMLPKCMEEGDVTKTELSVHQGKLYVWWKPNTSYHPENIMLAEKHSGGSVILGVLAAKTWKLFRVEQT